MVEGIFNTEIPPIPEVPCSGTISSVLSEQERLHLTFLLQKDVAWMSHRVNNVGRDDLSWEEKCNLILDPYSPIRKWEPPKEKSFFEKVFGNLVMN